MKCGDKKNRAFPRFTDGYPYWHSAKQERK